MTIRRKIAVWIIVLSITSLSFAPVPVYTETIDMIPKANNDPTMVTFILANRTFGVVDDVLTGKTKGGNIVSYNFTVSEGWNVYALEPGKYTAIFHGCNNLNGRKVLDLRAVKQKKVKLCCPSQNKPPHKIWIR
ncbi:MAG: hypothetical protein MUO77_17055 [Anaerolineales bacterium]|nr:hypothetical protein [Anaerolineales bacterium]